MSKLKVSFSKSAVKTSNVSVLQGTQNIPCSFYDMHVYIVNPLPPPTVLRSKRTAKALAQARQHLTVGLYPLTPKWPSRVSHCKLSVKVRLADFILAAVTVGMWGSGNITKKAGLRSFPSIVIHCRLQVFCN